LEDVAEMREWLRSEMTLWMQRDFPHWEVRVAADSLGFQIEMGKERPALALLDEVLGPGDGVAGVLPFLKQSSVPFLVMSSGLEKRELPEGALKRLTKPVWSTGEGVIPFLNELGQVMALTERGKIG
jgi:hypothetical protein